MTNERVIKYCVDVFTMYTLYRVALFFHFVFTDMNPSGLKQIN